MAYFDRMNQATMNSNPLGLRGNQLRSYNQVNQPPSNFGPQNAYDQAIPQQAQDYDEIMQGYRGMMGGSDPYSSVIAKYNQALGAGGNQFKPVSYQEAPEWAGAYAKAQEYANTGGLSDAEQGNLRARAISPIRSVYANMTRNMDRQRRLSGGFSPNYNASAARMAREGSEQIAQTTTNANAAIAEMVQKGRLAMTPEMARLASGKNELMNQVALGNQSNAAKYADSQASLLAGLRAATEGSASRKGDALKGMTTLYGTNPALVETFGNQNARTRSQLENETQGRASRRGPRQIYSGAPRSFGM